MLTLGLETSCDETGVAVVEDGRHVRSSVVHSQVPVHARYGGVVPELASRNHVVAILDVLQRALEQAGVGLEDLDQVAVTRGPGLVGALMVGVETAKAIGYACDLPVRGVNHLEGHLLSPFVDADCHAAVGFPYVALVVSGGHTALYHAAGVGRYELLGRTLDDAAGEAFDKVAKRLGAGYPGGPWIERTASGGDPRRYPLPSPMLGRGLDFSFSGLKTAAMALIEELERTAGPGGPWIPDVCAAVQAAVVRVLVQKALQAARRTGAPRLVVAGGVACNGALREAAREGAERAGLTLIVPSRHLCTDNGAMIACVGALREEVDPRPRHFAEFELDVKASLGV
jgi:N6-L-threonylcarbamoyladenine synthase